jgi:hypothetical protein
MASLIRIKKHEIFNRNYSSHRNQCSSISVVTLLWVERRGIGMQFLGNKQKFFSYLAPERHRPPSSLLAFGTRTFSRSLKSQDVKLTTHKEVMQGLTMHGVTLPLLHTPSWRGI